MLIDSIMLMLGYGLSWLLALVRLGFGTGVFLRDALGV